MNTRPGIFLLFFVIILIVGCAKEEPPPPTSVQWPHVQVGGDNLWYPAPGYVWTYLDQKGKVSNGDYSVSWKPGIRYQYLGQVKWPHVIASDQEGRWLPEDGYTWRNLDSNGRPIPGNFAVQLKQAPTSLSVSSTPSVSPSFSVQTRSPLNNPVTVEWKEYISKNTKVKFSIPSNWKVTSQKRDFEFGGFKGTQESIECTSPDSKIVFEIASRDVGFTIDDRYLLERLAKEMFSQMTESIEKSYGFKVPKDSIMVEEGSSNNIKGIRYQAVVYEENRKKRIVGVYGFYRNTAYDFSVLYDTSLDESQMQAFIDRIFEKLFAYEPSSEKKAEPKSVWQVEGFWKSEGGSLFKVRQNGKNLVVLWAIPSLNNQKYKYSQIKEDVVALEGTVEDDMITGNWMLYYDDQVIDRCPNVRGAWKAPTGGKILQNGNVITWTRADWSINRDTCEFQRKEEYTATWRRWQ